MSQNRTADELRRDTLIGGCYRIDEKLGAAVKKAFDAGYTTDQVHSLLSIWRDGHGAKS
jgi:hypothetical protein